MGRNSHPLDQRPIHLGPGGAATVLPALTDPDWPGWPDAPDWYAGYDSAHGHDGAEGRLVSLHHGVADWPHWEMHPLGDEVVVCTAGAATLIQRDDNGHHHRIPLAPGDHAINPSGVWHTADIATHATLLFITVGGGTCTKPR